MLFLVFLFVRNPRLSSYSRGTPSTSARVCQSEYDPLRGQSLLFARMGCSGTKLDAWVQILSPDRHI